MPVASDRVTSASISQADTELPARRVYLNVAANTLHTLLNALAGFITLPFLIGQLGAATYGLWTLLVAVGGYFSALDLGVSAALGRLVAGYRGKGDMAAINSAASTTFFLLAGLGVFVAAATFAATWLFVAIFPVPLDQVADVQTALLIIGLTMALYYPAILFEGVLWGYERFDLTNLVDIPALITRTALMLLFIRSGSSLTVLACFMSVPTIAAYLVKALICWRLEPKLSISWRHVRRNVTNDVFEFGSWFGVLTAARASLPQLATFVIGHVLGPVAVTTFTIPRLLVAYANWLLVSSTQVISPRAALFHFAERHAEQRSLFVEGGRYSLALSLYLFGGLTLLGAPLLDLWQPHRTGLEYPILVVLILGELIPLSQWVTYNAILSVGRHRVLALLAIVEIVALAISSYLVVNRSGLLGVAVCVALAATVFRGLAQAAYGCRLVRIPLSDYFGRAMGPVALAAAMPLLSFAALALWQTPHTWPGFIASGALYSILFWVVMLPFLRGWGAVVGFAKALSAYLTGRSARSRANSVEEGL